MQLVIYEFLVCFIVKCKFFRRRGEGICAKSHGTLSDDHKYLAGSRSFHRRSPFAVATALWSPTVDDYANPKLRSQLSAPLSRCGKRAPFLSRDRAAIGFPPLSEGVTIDLVLVGLTVESSLPNS